MGRELPTYLGLDFKFTKNIIVGDYGPFEGFMAHLVDLVKHNFKFIYIDAITPEKYFMGVHVEEVRESENFRTYTKLIHTILDNIQEKADLKNSWNNNANILWQVNINI